MAEGKPMQTTNDLSALPAPRLRQAGVPAQARLLLDVACRVAHVPCAHLVEAPEPHCHIARRFPADCPGCPAYSAGLTAQERVRCEVWTRVMGYHRPVAAFNPGKQSEHQERQYFREHPAPVAPQSGPPTSAPPPGADHG